MQLQVKGKNLEVSDSIRSYAERKLAKLDKQVHDDDARRDRARRREESVGGRRTRSPRRPSG